jgi:CelD/BcsL family acetyltransferase involved in cellulose biosynthesis
MKVSVARPEELGPAEIAAWHRMQSQTNLLANPFLCPEFAIAVGSVSTSARVAVLADGPEIIGFFPFERRPFGVGEPIGRGLSGGQGIIHSPGAELDPRQLLRECGLSAWRFYNLIEGQQSFAPYAYAAKRASVIDLADGFSAYREMLRARSPHHLSELARKARKLERESGELRFEADSRDRGELRLLMRWKSDQLRRNRSADIFARPWVVGLIDYLTDMRQDTFGGFLSVLYAGAEPVAAHFGLQFGNVLSGWFPAYDMRFSKLSPGLLQLLRMAEANAARGIRLIDMGTGTESYKQVLRSHDLLVTEGAVTTGRLAAGAYRAGGAGAGWARRRIKRHPLLFRAADRAARRFGGAASAGTEG